MDKEHKLILLGILASGVIAPTISFLVAYLIKKFENRNKR